MTSSAVAVSENFTMNDDGILETLRDGILVQRVPSQLLENSEDESFDWCNTCNHNTKFKWSFFETAAEIDGDENVATSQKIQAWDEAAARWQTYYNGRLQETRMDHWFRILGDVCGERCRNAIVLSISTDQQNKYFEPTSQLAQNGSCARQLYEEEANELATELLLEMKQVDTNLEPPPQGWFVRTSACSPKDAFQDGSSGPHHSLAAVLLALMASDRVHRTLRKDDCAGKDLRVYLMPFDDEVNVERELRVFIHKNQIRAMSQYHVYGSSEVFSKMLTADLAQLAKDVDAFHRSFVKPRWTINASYTMDIEVLKGGEIRLMELNSFGAELAAASSLFHWERDEKLLYGSDDESSQTAEQDTEEHHPIICIRVRE